MVASGSHLVPSFDGCSSFYASAAWHPTIACHSDSNCWMDHPSSDCHHGNNIVRAPSDASHSVLEVQRVVHISALHSSSDKGIPRLQDVTVCLLTHWGQVTHICVGKLTIIGSDNGLSLRWCQAIIWTNAWILFIRPFGTNFSEILIEIHIFSSKKMHLKMSSGNWRPFCLGLNVLKS